jgi:hypothetical protein
VFCAVSAYAGGEYGFDDFPPVKGNFKEVYTREGDSILRGVLVNGLITDYFTGQELSGKFVYDSQNLLKERQYYYEGKIYSKTVYQYDGKKRLLESSYYASSDNGDLVLNSQTSYQYKDDSYTADYEEINPYSREVFMRGTVTFYSFQKGGMILNLTEEKLNKKAEKWEFSRSLKNTYDKKGMLVEAVYQFAKSASTYYTKYELDKNGNVTKITSSSNRDFNDEVYINSFTYK